MNKTNKTAPTKCMIKRVLWQDHQLPHMFVSSKVTSNIFVFTNGVKTSCVHLFCLPNVTEFDQLLNC